jgi:small subunit ribosomal protein S1
METSVVTASSRSSEIKPKMHFTGTVAKTTLAGALVDIGIDMPAVIHISQLGSGEDGQPVKRVEDVLQVGQQVEVWVRKVKEGRIELTMTKPLDLEWRDIKKGMTVKGNVTRLEKFGAFIEIGAERPGLIHISEMAHGYVRAPSDVLKEGDEVEAQVLDVNRRKKQIKLSLKALQPEPVKEEEPTKIIEGLQKEKATRRRKPQKSEEGRQRSRQDAMDNLDDGANQGEPEPTVMEIALREAMEKAKARKIEQTGKGKRNKITKEQEDIFTRTLENKIRSS